MDWAKQTHGSVANTVRLFALLQTISAAPFVGLLLNGTGFTWMGLAMAITPVTILIGLLIHGHGSPRNWWQFFHGYEVKASPDFLEKDMFGNYEATLGPEPTLWLTSYARSHKVKRYGKVQFLYKSDSVMFKLAFG